MESAVKQLMNLLDCKHDLWMRVNWKERRNDERKGETELLVNPQLSLNETVNTTYSFILVHCQERLSIPSFSFSDPLLSIHSPVNTLEESMIVNYWTWKSFKSRRNERRRSWKAFSGGGRSPLDIYASHGAPSELPTSERIDAEVNYPSLQDSCYKIPW